MGEMAFATSLFTGDGLVANAALQHQDGVITARCHRRARLTWRGSDRLVRLCPKSS
jgi:hypothetical protein